MAFRGNQRPTAHEDPETAGNTPTRAAREASSTIISTYRALNDSEPHYISSSAYSTIRHTHSWVYYRGTSTTVPISILGSKPLPKDRRIALQRRGFRTGLLGWTIGGWLGGTIGKEIDVTPQTLGSWESDIEAKQREQYLGEVKEFLGSAVGPKDHKVLETDLVHIPVSSGDGYFRLLVYPSASSRSAIASTAPFRIGSLSLRSAHPRGASIVTFLPELALKVVSVTATTAAWTSFYTAFPLLKVAQMIPGTNAWGNWAMTKAYKLAGGQEMSEGLKERYQFEEKRQKGEKFVYQNVSSGCRFVSAEMLIHRVVKVPFGSMGVRTAYDLEEDAKKGRGGMFFRHT
jgi:hypothetical protein